MFDSNDTQPAPEQASPPDQPAETPGANYYGELSQLVGGLAHEIKNPLSTISLNLKLLSEDLSSYRDEEHQRLSRRVQRVAGEADRLREILNDFLRYAGKVELQPQWTDLCEVLEELSDFFGPQAQAGKVIFRVQLPSEPLRTWIDVNLIKQALLNLLINATQAMAGEPGGELLLRACRDGNSAIVEVIDSGPGIPEDDLDRIFRAYWSSKKDGTGLGLPTARRICREHGGDLRVESQPGQGTRFMIFLPLAIAAES
jgi:signal transduction histidine kinase